MLLRTTDPFRDLDRLTQQIFGTTNRPAVMPVPKPTTNALRGSPR